MQQDSTTNQETQTILDEYANLRWQKTVIEAKLREIEPLAISTALDIVGSGKAANGKQVVYRTDTVDITLQFRTQEPKPEEHPDLETLKELIEIEEEKALRINANAIAKVKEEIALLEAHLMRLKQTDDGLEYTAEYEKLVKSLTTKKPILSVKLK
jgi:hypothetical protein